MSFTGRRREHQPLLQPLSGASPPPLGIGHNLLVQHGERHQRSQQAGVSPGGQRMTSGGGRMPARSAARPITMTPTQQAAARRDKFIPLPEEDEAEEVAPTAAAMESLASSEGAAGAQEFAKAGSLLGDDALALSVGPGIFDDLPRTPSLPPVSTGGRVTVYGVADSFDRSKLHQVLFASFAPSTIKVYPDCFYVEFASPALGTPGADVFFFDYGVCCCWGLEPSQEMSVIRNIAALARDQEEGVGVEEDDMEVDMFAFHVSSSEKPHIQNDVVTLPPRASRDHRVKLAISYALSQSTKLSVYERRVVDMVLETRHLPEELAETGEVPLSSEDVARLIGKVFLQRAAVNLLSSVLGTPEFFWREADSYQALYARMSEYVELSTRVEVLNSRFAVLGEMLDMLRAHLHNAHSTRLEMIVIALILVEVVLGVFELFGLFVK